MLTPVCLSVSPTSPVQHHPPLGGGCLSFWASVKAVALLRRLSGHQLCGPAIPPVFSLFVCFVFFFFMFLFSHFLLQHADEPRCSESVVGCRVLRDDMHRLKRLTYHDVCGVMGAIIYSPDAAI